MAIIPASTLLTKGLVPATELQRLGKGEARPRDIHAPNFDLIFRAGQGAQAFGISDAVRANISEIKYEDNSEQFDKLTITLENQIDNSGGGDVLSLVDSKIFAEGHRIEVRMGWGNSLFTVGACVLVKKAPDFPSDGLPTLVIEGFDLLYLASRSRPKTGVSYVGSRDSQIASIIGARNGFDISVEDSRSFAGIRKTEGTHKRVQKKGISDYEFLKKVADINGFDLFSKFNPDLKKFSLFFQPAALAKQRETFTFVYNAGDVSYKNSLLSFTPTLDAYDQSTEFDIFLITNKKKGGPSVKNFQTFNNKQQNELIEARERRLSNSSAATQESIFNDEGIQVAFKAFGRSFKFPAHKRFKSEADARRAIQEFVKRQKENFITGTGSLLGNEVVQSRQVHNLQGIGKQFSGKYYLTQVVHTMSKDDTYQTEFSCRKVIEDVFVQSPPEFQLSEKDKRIEKVKKEESGRSSVVSGGDEEE